MPSIKEQLGFTNCKFWERPGRAEWRASFCPVSSNCHSGVAWMCWWTRLKRQKDCKQTAWMWVLSTQRKCVQQYWWLRMFKRVCLLRSTKPNYQKQLRKGLCSNIFLVTRLMVNPLKPELNPICYLLALLGAHHFLHVSRIRVISLTFRRLTSYIYIYIWSTHSWCF